MPAERDDAPVDAIDQSLTRALASAYLRHRAEATQASAPAEPDLPAGGKTPTSDVPAGGNEALA